MRMYVPEALDQDNDSLQGTFAGGLIGPKGRFVTRCSSQCQAHLTTNKEALKRWERQRKEMVLFFCFKLILLWEVIWRRHCRGEGQILREQDWGA